MNDRVFNDDAARFAKNIYGTLKGEIRTQVLQADLNSLAGLAPTSVLDVGAGIGQLGGWFASHGHRVTHLEPSQDMLDEARKLHTEKGVVEQFNYVHGSLQTCLPEQPAHEIVLCHAVLEWLSDPYKAFHLLVNSVKPGGWLSLMFYNVDAKRFANLIYGNFDYVKANLSVKKKVRFSPSNPLKVNDLLSWIAQTELSLITHSGVRCIHDYLRHPDKVDDKALLAEELRYRRVEPYRSLGRYQHLLLRKPY